VLSSWWLRREQAPVIENEQGYAERLCRRALDSLHCTLPCGIILTTALWVLCRYRHKTHWTRHSSRLDRDLGRKRFADAGYAMEELVAEIGAAFLCADLGITPETRDDHAAYIASWLKVLKNDKRAIFTAASHAQKATDYLHGLQPQTATGDDMREAA
jgi:antirestriction protein ArdC